MAAGIAHEIRNPLASMSGSMQMLKQELPLSADQAQLMDIVLKESERLNQTIKSFLAYARPQRFSLQRLDLRPMVQETAMLLRNSTEVERSHEVEVRQAESRRDGRRGRGADPPDYLEPRDQRPARDAERRHAVPQRDARRDAPAGASRCCWSRTKASAFRPRTSI